MFRSPQIIKKWAWLACVGTIAILACPARGQNFSMQIANPDPIGLRDIFPTNDVLGFNTSDGIKGAFGYNLFASTVYDSNFFITEKNPESELTLKVTPSIYYTSDPEGGARYSITANYSPTMRAYLHNSDLGGIDQAGNVAFKFVGSKTLVTVFSRYSEVSGNDRLSGGYVTGSLMNTGVNASYQIAPRTSIVGKWLSAISDYSTGASVGSQIYTTEIGSYWAATERFRFGPAIRYTTAQSDNIGSRDAWSGLLQAEYLAGERIRLRGSIGLEFASYSQSGQNNTVSLTGDLNASYVINDRWSWSNSMLYATIPSPADSGYLVNNLEISSAIQRQLLRGSVEFGLDYNLSNFENVGTSVTNLGDEDNLRVFVGYKRNIFSERLGFESRIDYAINDGQQNWSQVQLTAGLTLSF